MAIDLHSLDRQPTRSHPLPMIGIRQIPSLFRITAITNGSIGLPALSLTGQLALRKRAEPEVDTPPHECSCGLALAGYGEEIVSTRSKQLIGEHCRAAQIRSIARRGRA